MAKPVVVSGETQRGRRRWLNGHIIKYGIVNKIKQILTLYKPNVDFNAQQTPCHVLYLAEDAVMVGKTYRLEDDRCQPDIDPMKRKGNELPLQTRAVRKVAGPHSGQTSATMCSALFTL